MHEKEDVKFYENSKRDFPGVSLVKNPPSNTGGIGEIPGWGPKILHATGQWSPHTRQWRSSAAKIKNKDALKNKTIRARKVKSTIKMGGKTISLVWGMIILKLHERCNSENMTKFISKLMAIKAMGVDKTATSKKRLFLCFVSNWLEQNSFASTDTWLTDPKKGVFQDFFNSHFFHSRFHQFQGSCFIYLFIFYFFAFQCLANSGAIYNECYCHCFLTKSCLILWDSQGL